MFGRIESTAGNSKPLVVLLVLVAVLAITVTVQVSRFAGAADASSEPQPDQSITPVPTGPATPDPGTAGKPPAGSGTTPDATPGSTPDATPPPSATTTPSDSSSNPPDPGVPYTISGTISPPLHPGGAAVPIDVAFSSTNVGNGGRGIAGVRVSSLVVSITSVTGPHINGSRPCSAADFALSQFSGAYPFYVPAGASSLSLLGFGSEAWPTLRMKETGSNQNGCRGATVILAYTGTP